jgi:hypothetical protein
LGELLWVNRQRLLAGKKVQGIRRIQLPTDREAEDMVLHVLRRDGQMRAWYGRIQRRRGSKIARVAVMRRLATIIWPMVQHNEPYMVGGPPRRKRADKAA